MGALAYVAIFLCSLVLEIGWVSSVRSVAAGREWLVVLNAVVMQGISNTSTLILVRDSWTSLASVLGAAIGAFLGMRIPVRSLSVEGRDADVL